MEIAPNVHRIPDVVANLYLLFDPDGLTLIDAGLPRSEGKILKYLASLGRAPSDLKRVLITHADLDHVGSLARLKGLTGARVYAGPIEAEAIAAGRPSREIDPGGWMRLLFAAARPLFRTRPTPVDESLSEGQTLPLLGGLRVVATPGHTPGHVSFFAPAAGILFSGDSMVSDSAGALLPSRPPVTWDARRARESVEVQAALGATVVCPGHGPVVKDAGGKFPHFAPGAA